MQQSLTLIPYAINWDAPADDGGSKIDKYQVRFAVHDGGYSDWVDLKGADTKFFALLPDDEEIDIELRAVNDVGPGEANMIKMRPKRESDPRDSKKRIGSGSVPIHLSDPPKMPEK